jgi:hypothetical protein
LIEHLPDLVNGDSSIVRWGRGMNETFMVEVGERHFFVSVEDGYVRKVEKGPFVQRSWRFAIRARQECWDQFWKKTPEPGWHDLFALLRRGDVRFEGDQRVLMAYLLYVKLLLEACRR